MRRVTAGARCYGSFLTSQPAAATTAEQGVRYAFRWSLVCARSPPSQASADGVLRPTQQHRDLGHVE